MADSTGTSQDAETPKKKTLLRIVALLLLCVVALAGGFVASVGPQGAMELVGLADDPEDEAATSGEDAAEDHAAGDGHGAAPATPAGLPGEHIVVTPFQEIIVNITATAASSPASTMASGEGNASRKGSNRSATRETCVCCNMNSDTRARHGVRTRRQGRSRAEVGNQRVISPAAHARRSSCPPEVGMVGSYRSFRPCRTWSCLQQLAEV